MANGKNDMMVDRVWYDGSKVWTGRLVACLVGLALVAVTASVVAQEPGQDVPGGGVPEGLKEYLGRRIAPTMSFAGADWLIRDEREDEERCSLMLTNLGLQRGMTICDMGCGNGFYSIKMAQMVGPAGQILAVDIQPEMLTLLRDRCEAEGVDNVTPILGSLHHPRLPRNSVDLVLMVDVYHEFSHPVQMLAAIREALKPDGRVVLVEYRAEDPKVPILPLHKMTKIQVEKELTANGFQLVEQFDRLPWQHMMFFGKAATTAGESEGSDPSGQ